MWPDPVMTKLASVSASRVLGIVEVEHRGSFADAARDGSDMVAQNFGFDHVARFHPVETVRKRDPRAGDRCRARTAICLNNIAIDCDLALAQRLQIDHRTKRFGKSKFASRTCCFRSSSMLPQLPQQLVYPKFFFQSFRSRFRR